MQTPESWLATLLEALKIIPSLENDFIVDDRHKLSLGKRVLEAKKAGYSFIIVLGKKTQQTVPLFELIDTNNNQTKFLNITELVDYLKCFL